MCAACNNVTVKEMSDYFEDYSKMKVLRKMAEKSPNSQLVSIIETVDEVWDEEILRLQQLKKTTFVTKF